MSFSFWLKYLKVLSAVMALQGASWALLGSFDPLGFYDGIFAREIFGQDSLPADAERAKAFLLGPFGATDAGYFILFYFIVAEAFARREAWAHRALCVAVAAWFLLDCAVSAYHGAYFNIYVVNLPAICLLAPPLIFTRKYFRPDTEHA